MNKVMVRVVKGVNVRPQLSRERGVSLLVELGRGWHAKRGGGFPHVQVWSHSIRFLKYWLRIIEQHTVLFAVNIEYVTLSQIRKKGSFVYMFLVNKHETCSISNYLHKKITHYDGVLRFYKSTYYTPVGLWSTKQ